MIPSWLFGRLLNWRVVILHSGQSTLYLLYFFSNFFLIEQVCVRKSTLYPGLPCAPLLLHINVRQLSIDHLPSQCWKGRGNVSYDILPEGQEYILRQTVWSISCILVIYLSISSVSLCEGEAKQYVAFPLCSRERKAMGSPTELLCLLSMLYK